MSHLPSFSATAFLIADPTRAAMLTALLVLSPALNRNPPAVFSHDTPP